MISKEFIEKFDKTIKIEHKDIIIEFFITFSRFEYTLKSTGFLKKNTNKAEPNWEEFVKSIRPQFEQSEREERLIKAIDYLEKNPPKTQSILTGQLKWEERQFDENIPLINKLSILIRGVRNNLFHGGKYQTSYEKDVVRDYDLLKSSLIVLNYWLVLNDAVTERFLTINQ